MGAKRALPRSTARRRKRSQSADPITVEVVRHSFISAAWEMFRVFKRTTTLAVLYEMTDFAMCIYDRDVNLLAESPGVPFFAGSLDPAIRATLVELGEDKMEPGDVVINNHPYLVGGQPADATVFAPIFYRDHLVGYVGLRAHMGDCGAINQYPVSTVEIFQEGTILPAVKLFRRGVLDEAILRTIKANSRLPLETGGNYIAGAASLNAGCKRISEIVERFGLETVEAAKERIYEHAEQLTRKAIAEIPDGEYKIVDFMDSNGIDDEPLRIELTVTIKGTDIIMDFTGSAPQQRAPVNCPHCFTETASRFALRLLTVPHLPTNSGMFRPLTIIAPEGTIFNPVSPAPAWCAGWTASRVTDLMPLALARALPHKIPAPPSGVHNLALAYVKDPVRAERTHFTADVGPSGLGGTACSDGASALTAVMQAGSVNIPAEVQESKTPIMIERYELSTNCGAGKFRGGCGSRIVIRYLGNGQMTTVMERTKFQLQGLHGGKAASKRCELIFRPDTPGEKRLHKTDGIAIAPGDRLILETTGGAGYGNPLERDPERVRLDVLNEIISTEEAKEDYGVVIDGNSLQIDHKASLSLRDEVSRKGNGDQGEAKVGLIEQSD